MLSLLHQKGKQFFDTLKILFFDKMHEHFCVKLRWKDRSSAWYPRSCLLLIIADLLLYRDAIDEVVKQIFFHDHL